MNITGKITGIKYEVLLSSELPKFELGGLDINTVPTSCTVNNGANSFAISKWVSPKRTRSYPYERVYNTLSSSKKITIIPIVKDEGATGDRDYLQWDTVSLMSLLDIFVIFAYYNKAEKKGNKITKQQFDNAFVIQKIKEIEQYHSSALHWNLNEIKNLQSIVSKVISSYDEIEKTTGVKLHSSSGLGQFQKSIGEDVSKFMEFSRGKAEKAQSREFVTKQPKEIVATLSKAKITIINYLGGQYFFTVDEIKIVNGIVSLIECKHSSNALLPSKGDIKDGLLKMILYCNLTEVEVDGIKVTSVPMLDLTSKNITGHISTTSSKVDIENFFIENKFPSEMRLFVCKLFDEATRNKITVNIKQGI